MAGILLKSRSTVVALGDGTNGGAIAGKWLSGCPHSAGLLAGL